MQAPRLPAWHEEEPPSPPRRRRRLPPTIDEPATTHQEQEARASDDDRNNNNKTACPKTARLVNELERHHLGVVPPAVLRPRHLREVVGAVRVALRHALRPDEGRVSACRFASAREGEGGRQGARQKGRHLEESLDELTVVHPRVRLRREKEEGQGGSAWLTGEPTQDSGQTSTGDYKCTASLCKENTPAPSSGHHQPSREG